jgi:hypothetical protein
VSIITGAHDRRQGRGFIPVLALFGIWLTPPAATAAHDLNKAARQTTARLGHKSKSKFHLPQRLKPAAPVARDVPLWIGLLVAQILYIVVFHSLSNLPLRDRLLFGTCSCVEYVCCLIRIRTGVHSRFWMQPNIVVFLWAGVGFHVVVRRCCA